MVEYYKIEYQTSNTRETLVEKGKTKREDKEKGEVHMQTCYLVGAAPGAVRIEKQPGDYVIAADGGLDHLERWGLTPDFVVGDMDSLRGALPEDVPYKRVPAEKDDTDMALAFMEGYDRGQRRFVLTGASGGRMDHTAANLQLLVKAAKRGAFALLRDEACCVTALCREGELRLHGKGTVSVFAYGDQAGGVSISGMQYCLDRETLCGDSPRGVSNALDGDGMITMESGTLLVFWEPGIEALVNI